MAKDFYAVLGVPRTATAAQIRARFLDLARQMHPDRFQGLERQRAEEEFQAITEAFNTLGDPERRRRHDLDLLRPAAPAAAERPGRACLARGIKAYRDRDWSGAWESLQHATREEPGNPLAFYYLALAGSQREAWLERAAAAAARACELDPINAAYLKLAGQLCLRLDRPARAVSYLEGALRWGGEDPPARAALEEARRVAGRRAGGLFGRQG